MYVLVTYDEFDHDTDYAYMNEEVAIRELRYAATSATEERRASPSLYKDGGKFEYDLDTDSWC